MIVSPPPHPQFYLVAGGQGSNGQMTTTEILALGSSSWLTASPLPRALYFTGAHVPFSCHGAAGAGPVLCIGGLRSAGNINREEVRGLEWTHIGYCQTPD